MDRKLLGAADVAADCAPESVYVLRLQRISSCVAFHITNLWNDYLSLNFLILVAII